MFPCCMLSWINRIALLLSTPATVGETQCWAILPQEATCPSRHDFGHFYVFALYSVCWIHDPAWHVGVLSLQSHQWTVPAPFWFQFLTRLQILTFGLVEQPQDFNRLQQKAVFAVRCLHTLNRHFYMTLWTKLWPTHTVRDQVVRSDVHAKSKGSILWVRQSHPAGRECSASQLLSVLEKCSKKDLVGSCAPLQLTALLLCLALPAIPEHKPLLRLNSITPGVLAKSAQEFHRQRTKLKAFEEKLANWLPLHHPSDTLCRLKLGFSSPSTGFAIDNWHNMADMQHKGRASFLPLGKSFCLSTSLGRTTMLLLLKPSGYPCSTIRSTILF